MPPNKTYILENYKKTTTFNTTLFKIKKIKRKYIAENWDMTLPKRNLKRILPGLEANKNSVKNFSFFFI